MRKAAFINVSGRNRVCNYWLNKSDFFFYFFVFVNKRTWRSLDDDGSELSLPMDVCNTKSVARFVGLRKKEEKGRNIMPTTTSIN